MCIKERREKKKKKEEQKLLVCVTQYPLKPSLILSCNLGSCLPAEKVGKGKRKPRQGNLRARIYVLQSIKVGQERYDKVPEIR